MLNRNVVVTACVCLAASVAAFGQGTGYLFQLPGPNSSGSQFLAYVYNANSSTPVANAPGPTAASQALAKPDGTRFYILGTSGVQSFDANFKPVTSISGLGGTPTSMTMTPDGKLLLVGAGDVYAVDTSSDQIAGASLGVSGTVANSTLVGIAVSRDSKVAFVLTNTAFGSAVTAINLATRTRFGQQLVLSGGATSIVMSPLGLLYVTAVNRIYEIDPGTLTVTPSGSIPLVFSPGILRFTPDGTAAYTVNQTPDIGGQSLLKLTVANHAVSTWPSFSNTQSPLFDDVFVAGNNRVFALSSTRPATSLWDVNTGALSASSSSLSSVIGTNGVSNVLAVGISNEVPSARYLYLLIANGNQTNLNRIDLTTNAVSLQSLAAINTGIFQFAAVPPQTGATSFLQFNNPQTITATSPAAPLIARVLASNGQPVFNLPVTFTTDPANGLVINSPNQTTNADGYVQTTVTVPSAAGTYIVTLTAGAVSTTFTLTVPGTGGGGGGGSSQVTIASGDGQVVLEFFSSTFPLTVKVTDTNGKPLPNAAVAFSVTAGNGFLDNPNAVTDTNGLASTFFSAGTPAAGAVFEPVTVNASTAVGSVNFTETSYHVNFDGSGRPGIYLLAPGITSNNTITVAQGGVAPNAVQAQVISGNFPQLGAPIPGAGITLLNGIDPSQPSPASCQGSSLSDNSGVASCNVLATCQIGTFPLSIVVAGLQSFQASIHITAGAATALKIIGGNNQSGIAGQTLPVSLQATVTDGCGAPIAGVPVLWSVLSGSATLTGTVSVSNSGGVVTTRVTLGQTPGPVQVQLSITNVAKVVFNLTNQVVVAGISIVSGSNQTVVIGQKFPQPVTALVRDASNNPLAGILVTFAVASGSATVNPATATTDSQGHASTSVTAGNTAGAITISASAASFSTTATLTSRLPGPSVTAASFTNAGSNAPGLVPCGLATVVGAGLAPGVQGVVSGINPFGPLPLNLSGVSITVNGVQAPIQAVANQGGKEQVNFQTPCEVPPGSASVVVTVSGGGNTTVTGVPVLQAQPGIFTFQGATGKAYGAVIRALDGSYVTPTNPAHRGETYYLVVTGLGLVNPPTATNSTGIAGQDVVVQVIVGVHDAGVPVISAQYLVGWIGAYIVGFQIPADAPTGPDQTLAIAAIVNGQVVFGNPAFLAGVI